MEITLRFHKNVEVFYVSSEGNKNMVTNESMDNILPHITLISLNLDALQKKINLLSVDTIPGYVSILELHADGSMVVLNNRHKRY